MRRKLELFIKAVIGLTFFVPIIFLPKHFIFPFIVPKIVVFRSLALIMLGAYIILLVMDWHRYKLRAAPITIAVLFFIASFAVSTIVSVDWYRSFWDNHERMLGLFTVIHYVIFYLVLTSVVKEWNEWRLLSRVFLFAGGIVMLMALLQHLNPEFLLNRSGDRASSTLGNPIYVGGYGLFLSFIGWLLFVKEDILVWKWGAAVIGFLGILGVFFSGSRGAFVGFASGVFVLMVYYITNLKNNGRVRAVLIGIIIVGFLSLAMLYPFRKSNFVKNMPAIGRLLNTSFKTAGTRFMAWEIAIKGWKDKPILGWGPTNYYMAFNKYYNPAFLRFGYRETWFDSAHNAILNTLTEKGIIGEIAYLTLFSVPIILLWRDRRRKKLDLHIAGVGGAFLVAHLVQTISVFENPTSYIYLFFMLAFVNSTVSGNGTDRAKDLNLTDQLPIGVSVVVFLSVLLLIYSTNINPARANMATLDALRHVHRLNDPREAYKKALSIPTPHIDDVRNDFSRAVSGALRQYAKAKKGRLARDLYNLAFAELNKNRKMHPLDVRVHAQQALMAQEAASLSGDRSLLLAAEEIMADAMQKSPNRQQFQFTMAGIKIQLNKYSEAEAIYRKAIENEPRIAEGWWRLALLLDLTDKSDEAVSLIEEAKSKGIEFKGEGKPVVARILAESSKAVTSTDD